jgi:hypothetical protein
MARLHLPEILQPGKETLDHVAFSGMPQGPAMAGSQSGAVGNSLPETSLSALLHLPSVTQSINQDLPRSPKACAGSHPGNPSAPGSLLFRDRRGQIWHGEFRSGDFWHRAPVCRNRAKPVRSYRSSIPNLPRLSAFAAGRGTRRLTTPCYLFLEVVSAPSVGVRPSISTFQTVSWRERRAGLI